MLDMMNSSSEIPIFDPNEVIRILDLRLLGYYKIKQGVLQQIVSRFYEFELAEKICDQINNLINILQKEQNLDRRKIPMFG